MRGVLRVLFAASSGTPGGAELALATYLAHLPERVEGHGLVLSPGPVTELLAARLGRPVAVAGLHGRPSPAQAAAFQRALHRRLAGARGRPLEGFDVVLATGIKAAAMCALPCRAARVPLVWHKVDFSWDRPLARTLALLCTGVISVSAAAGAHVPAHRRLAVVPPPVRFDPGFRVSADRPRATLGSIGRLVPYKGHADVIAAAALLRERFPEVRVVIAGGPDPSAPGHEEELRAAARAHGLADRVELLGHVSEIEPVYERLTVLVQASHVDDRGFGREGFGATTAEAGWAGLPVVATSGGGAEEAMVDGSSGRLVMPNDPSAIADAAAVYLADPEAAHTAGEAGARFARERLAPAPLAERLVGALESVARRSAS
jgi:glycosyltransferase involved in cell wall biosynthesis